VFTGINIKDDWNNWGFASYVKLGKNQSVESLFGKIQPFWSNLIKERWNIEQGTERAEEHKLSLVPLKDSHFYNNNKKSFVYLIIVIGIIILALAVVNYINLSLAISTTRIKEIGVRKSIGSKRSNLFKQFVNESVIITLMASVVALFIVYISKSFYYDITGSDELIQLDKLWIGVLIFFLGVLAIGIVSGAYPAFQLTKIQPVHALRSELNSGKSSNVLKNILVVFQFVISISLIIAVFTISEQVNYMKTKKLGFNHEYVLYFAQSEGINEKYEVFKQTLMKNPNVLSVSRSNGPLGHQWSISSKHMVNGEDRTYSATTVDPDFINTMGIDFIEGRNFSWDMKSDFNSTALVNENFVKEFELEPVIGANVKFMGNDVTIIGVVKNFHNTSLHQTIEPGLLFYNDWGATVNIKINEKDIDRTIAGIQKIWDDFSEDMPFEYKFLDESYNELYKSETEFGLLIKVFSILAVCIACLGLFGLVSFTANKRKKEIGIRKINGAKIHEILSMLNQDITKWVLVAFIISCPIAYYTMTKWLENFAYKTELSWWIFAVAGFIALFIALATVSWQSWRAANRNPVEALRCE
jgi:putative ABC transport system permease protein